MREKTLNLLGLMRRANALVPGEDKAADTVKAGKAKFLLLSADISENARRRAEHLSEGRRVLTVPLPFDREELGAALGLGSCAMAAVTDPGFAKALAELLAAQWPEDFGTLAEETGRRLEKTRRRKAEKDGQRNKRIGKRRTNV